MTTRTATGSKKTAKKTTAKKTTEKKTAKKTAKKPARGGGFDPELMNVIGTSKLGDGIVAQVFQYDGGAPKVNFVKLNANTGKGYPVKSLTLEQFEKLVSKAERVTGHFAEAVVDDDGDDSDGDDD